jgi:hypothetical protein
MESPRKDCQQVISAAVSSSETRLCLTELASDRRLHAQSDRKHADAKPLMRRPEHASATGSEFLSISMEFCHFVKGLWLSRAPIL